MKAMCPGRSAGRGKSDSGLIYSTGRLVVGGQNGFDSAICDRLESELNAEMDLLNSTQNISDDLRRKALEKAVYYSGDGEVDARTWDSCGNQLVRSGHYIRSLVYYNRSIKADPSIPNAWNNRGVAFRNLGRYKEAVVSFDQALNLSPNSSVTWVDKGESLYRLGKNLPALDCFNRSISSGPSAPAWYDKGIILLGRGRYSAALDCFNQSISLDPYNALAWNNKGVAMAKMGKNDSAMSCFGSAATIDQKFAGAWANAGMALHALGLENKSLDAFSTARKLGYTSPKIKVYFLASTEAPVLMDETKKSGGLDVTVSIAMLFIVSLLMLGKKREGF